MPLLFSGVELSEGPADEVKQIGSEFRSGLKSSDLSKWVGHLQLIKPEAEPALLFHAVGVEWSGGQDGAGGDVVVALVVHDVEGEEALQVGLVEDRDHSVGVVRHCLDVEVLVAIRVPHSNQAILVCVICALCQELQHILAVLKPCLLEADLVVDPAALNLLLLDWTAVDGHLENSSTPVLDEGVTVGLPVLAVKSVYRDQSECH